MNGNEDYSSILDELSILQDKWMVLDEENQQLRQHIQELEARPTMEQIKTFHTRELKKVKKEAKRHQRRNSAIADERNQTERKLAHAMDELDMLRSRLSSLANEDSFDTEGHFQMLYKETLVQLQKEKEEHHQQMIQLKTKHQNTVEELKNVQYELKGLYETREIREVALIQGYEAILNGNV